MHSNDTAYLQNLINTADTAVIPKKNPLTGDELWIIDAPLLLDSNKTVILDGAHLRMADGVYANMFSTEYPLGGKCQHKENIAIIGKNGAVLDGGEYNGLSEKNAERDGLPHIFYNNMIFMRDVEGFEVSGLTIVEQRHWALNFLHCANGRVSDICFRASNYAKNQDGIDLRFGCHDIVIENIFGTTGDDTVALTALNHTPKNHFYIPDRCGDIYNVTIKNIKAACTGGHGIVRLLCHDGLQVHHILIEDITDQNFEIGKKNHAAIRIGDKNYSRVSMAKDSDIHHVTVRRVSSDASAVIKLYGYPENFVYEDITATDGEMIINTKE